MNNFNKTDSILKYKIKELHKKDNNKKEKSKTLSTKKRKIY